MGSRPRRRLGIPLVYKLVAAAALLMSSCGAPQNPLDGPPGCDAAAYADLVASTMAELVAECDGYDTLDACPEELKGPVQEKWEKKLDAWAECSSDAAE